MGHFFLGHLSVWKGCSGVLRGAAGLALTPSLLPEAVLPGAGAGAGLGPGCRRLCWAGLVSHKVAEKPTHLALLLNNLKKLFFSPLFKMFVYIVGDLENNRKV